MIVNDEKLIIDGDKVTRECDICGNIQHIKLEEEELESFKVYLEGGLLIQECLPTLNKCEREFLKSGYCTKCQELLFGNGYTKRLY